MACIFRNTSKSLIEESSYLPTAFSPMGATRRVRGRCTPQVKARGSGERLRSVRHHRAKVRPPSTTAPLDLVAGEDARTDRKSTRLNSSHANISYAVFC